jgi:hypothetical protein
MRGAWVFGCFFLFAARPAAAEEVVATQDFGSGEARLVVTENAYGIRLKLFNDGLTRVRATAEVTLECGKNKPYTLKSTVKILAEAKSKPEYSTAADCEGLSTRRSHQVTARIELAGVDEPEQVLATEALDAGAARLVIVPSQFSVKVRLYNTGPAAVSGTADVTLVCGDAKPKTVVKTVRVSAGALLKAGAFVGDKVECPGFLERSSQQASGRLELQYAGRVCAAGGAFPPLTAVLGRDGELKVIKFERGGATHTVNVASLVKQQRDFEKAALAADAGAKLNPVLLLKSGDGGFAGSLDEVVVAEVVCGKDAALTGVGVHQQLREALEKALEKADELLCKDPPDAGACVHGPARPTVTSGTIRG